MKRFSHYVKDDLNESSLLSKGFALGQNNRFDSTKRQLDSLVQQVDSLCNKAKLESDTEKKFDILLDSISRLAHCLKLSGDLSKNTINVAVASNLLEVDREQLFRKK
jgi:transcription termination factor Rho